MTGFMSEFTWECGGLKGCFISWREVNLEGPFTEKHQDVILKETAGMYHLYLLLSWLSCR